MYGSDDVQVPPGIISSPVISFPFVYFIPKLAVSTTSPFAVSFPLTVAENQANVKPAISPTNIIPTTIIIV